jgi:hypothetical protein
MECPALKETAKDKIAQRDLWSIIPDENDMAISVV